MHGGGTPRPASIGDDARLPGRNQRLLHLERRRGVSVRLPAGQRRRHALEQFADIWNDSPVFARPARLQGLRRQVRRCAATVRFAAAAAPAPTRRRARSSPKNRSARIDPIWINRFSHPDDRSSLSLVGGVL